MKRWATALALCAALLAAPDCHAQRAVGVRPDASTLEGGLWAAFDKAEQQAKQSGELNRAPELNAYVKEMVCKVSAAYCADVRVYVMDRPYFNATMAPNGYMEVWSGLLLRADNSAQVAFVLGHESGHFTHNHSLEMFKTMKARANAAMIFSIVTAAAGIPIVGDLAYLGTVASLQGFSRENEAEADKIGFDLAVAAGYDPSSGSALWRYLVAETQQSDFEKVRSQIARNSIFASHPLTADRIEALDTLAKAAPPGAYSTDADRHRAAIRPHLSNWLRDDLRRKDFGESLYLINHLARRGEDLGVLNFFKGEAYRLRRKDGDLALAKAAYLDAVKYPDAPPSAWRELGEIHMRDGRSAEAQAAFQAYLTASPNAQDRLLVEARLKTAQGETTP